MNVWIRVCSHLLFLRPILQPTSFPFARSSESSRECTDALYLQPLDSCCPNSPVWFSSAPLDDLTLETMLARICTVRELHGGESLQMSDGKAFISLWCPQHEVLATIETLPILFFSYFWSSYFILIAGSTIDYFWLATQSNVWVVYVPSTPLKGLCLVFLIKIKYESTSLLSVFMTFTPLFPLMLFVVFQRSGTSCGDRPKTTLATFSVSWNAKENPEAESTAWGRIKTQPRAPEQSWPQSRLGAFVCLTEGLRVCRLSSAESDLLEAAEAKSDDQMSSKLHDCLLQHEPRGAFRVLLLLHVGIFVWCAYWEIMQQHIYLQSFRLN